MNENPRIVFLLSESLGWRTYADQLCRVLAQRQDVKPVIVRFRHSKLLFVWGKRNNISPAQRIFRRFDPINLASVALHRRIHLIHREGRIHAAHVAAHTLSRVVTQLRPAIPFTAALDHTRFAMEKDLPRDVWSLSDMQTEARLVRRAVHLYPMSDWAARSLHRDCDVEHARITVMPPSTDLGRFRPRRHRDRELTRVLFVGNDFVRKGGDRLVRWVRNELRGRCELHIVSRDPACPTSGEGVVAHGAVANDRLVKELMPQMDLLCHPTRSDMSPHVVVEAAAAGLPVVASAISGIADLIHSGETGYLISPDDDRGFLRALEGLCLDRLRVARMGDAAAALARSKFSADTNYNQLIDRLISICSNGQRGN